VTHDAPFFIILYIFVAKTPPGNMIGSHEKKSPVRVFIHRALGCGLQVFVNIRAEIDFSAHSVAAVTQLRLLIISSEHAT